MPNTNFGLMQIFFDNTIEFRRALRPLSGEEILELTANICPTLGKDPITKKPTKHQCNPTTDEPSTAWKGKSIWFKLPYWKDHRKECVSEYY
jgi:hypothetical protein